ncbi:MAG TPA: LacI family DNA-binding transcriptional regulator [Candidatus Limnocylindrales bacterium]|nr:LacI family DNA-binding transcriptional regulator [Candidatus Limnocylindrales bacterium]
MLTCVLSVRALSWRTQLTVSNTQPRPRGVTLEEVARLAGVSRATVSRVVNGSPRVSGDVRRSVETAVEKLGYVPNRAARSLVTRRSGSIAVVITEPTGRLFSDPFFPRLLRGISTTVAARDVQVVLLMPETIGDSQRTADYLVAGHVDGAILVSLHGDDPLPGRIIDARIATVVVGRPLRNRGVSYVDVDNRGGARNAVEDLIAGGRRVIASIGGPADMMASQDRLHGYRDALVAAGLGADPTLEAAADFTQDGGAAAMRQLLAARPDLDAVFAASDLMAAGAMSVLDAAGRRVPEDVAIVGYDDSPVAATARPPLTSVRQPIEEMGQESARLLLELVEDADRAPRRVILTTELIRRASSAGRAMP